MLKRTIRLLLSLAVLLSAISHADPQSKSFSHWQLEGNQASVTFTVGHLEIARLPGYQGNPAFAQVLATHLSETVKLEKEGESCDMTSPAARRARPGYVQLYIQFQCPGPGTSLQVTISTLQSVVASHVHFARFTVAGQPSFELLFSRRQPSQLLALHSGAEGVTTQQGAGATLASYIVFGFEHILIGLDHIAFLLTLMLLTRRMRDIVWVITGFTIGHSITLSLATLGVATPNSYWVEAMIGFTIALVAIENISVQTGSARQAAWMSGAALALLALFSAWQQLGPPVMSMLGLALFAFCYLQLSTDEPRARRMRPMVTTGFGLIHGFGFANVLMEVGLPEQRILPALFGFNVGVELGQLVIVLTLACVGVLIRKFTVAGLKRWLSDILSAALCGLGFFWFVLRAYF